jgi:NAD-dependent DNA ligase
MQRLQGILHGILADGKIADEEIKQLSAWIDEHTDLKGCYPYDEIDALLTQVLKDGVIDDNERKMLGLFFEDFISYSLSTRVMNTRPGGEAPRRLSGICAVCPDLLFHERRYCFTGASSRAVRSEIQKLVERLGGEFCNSVSPGVHFLVVGANGNPAWAYACYGRKVEQAMKLRSAGHGLVIVHENDFWDATTDHGVNIA